MRDVERYQGTTVKGIQATQDSISAMQGTEETIRMCIVLQGSTAN